ncbi:hypothetical protein CS022_19820 [Veronia nyctiphanis]|uniref:Uncharacterized protein n=1 Tax=Veronia nyctiphanis TaxID=1278244 RepID=A0A4Q0YMP6_9GAMM|nr:hypothetical protein [Veronia nyctiphanis]RXJ71703.1 hypothetical protein CS022_19820 [Veronia nyctiphanis]
MLSSFKKTGSYDFRPSRDNNPVQGIKLTQDATQQVRNVMPPRNKKGDASVVTPSSMNNSHVRHTASSVQANAKTQTEQRKLGVNAETQTKKTPEEDKRYKQELPSKKTETPNTPGLVKQSPSAPAVGSAPSKILTNTADPVEPPQKPAGTDFIANGKKHTDIQKDIEQRFKNTHQIPQSKGVITGVAPDQRFNFNSASSDSNNHSWSSQNIGHASIPRAEIATDKTTPVFFLSPNALGEGIAPAGSVHSLADKFIQGDIDQSKLPTEILNDKDKLAALNDIRSRFDKNWTLQTSFNTNGYNYVDNGNEIFDGESDNYHQAPTLLNNAEGRNYSRPTVGSYIRTEISMPSNWTESGNEATIYGYSKVTNEGTVEFTNGHTPEDVLIRANEATTVNNTSSSIKQSSVDTNSSSFGQNQSSYENTSSQQSVGFSAGVSAGGGSPTRSINGEASVSYSSTNSQTSGAQTDINSGNGQQNSVGSNIDVQPFTIKERTDYYLGKERAANIKDVELSLPNWDIFDEFLDDNQDTNLYFQDSFDTFKPRGDEGSWVGLGWVRWCSPLR